MVLKLSMKIIIHRYVHLKELLESLGALFIASIIAIPILTIFYMALSSEKNIWPHLSSTVLPGYIITTLIVLSGVGVITLIIGIGLAWVITVYDFPMRRTLEWLCLIPLAMPTYIIAYTYGEIFDYPGFLQSALRFIFGWQSSKDYWFPNIYSTGGVIFVMSFVLYPYIYLTSRAAFLRQSMTLIEVSNTLGYSLSSSFFRVALPMARPAIIIGLILVMMESMNEFAAFEYYGVNTLSVGVYVTWLEKNNLSGAAQIAIFMLIFIFLLMLIERKLRNKRSFVQKNNNTIATNRYKLTGIRAYMLLIICLLPIMIGFIFPSIVLIDFIIQRYYEIDIIKYITLVFNSIYLSSFAAILTLIISIYLVNVSFSSNNFIIKLSIGISRLGYALPGVVLALGIIVPMITFDNFLKSLLGDFFGITTGLIISGTAIGVLYAYIVRFLTIAYGTIESGFSTLNPDLGDAARVLGRSRLETLVGIQLPIIKPALIAAVLLVFVDSMKELPATLLLRPFNFDTLATHVYTYASLSALEDAALPALTIVAVGIIPIIVINRVLMSSTKS
ncbi:MAG: iron ABC transporter permease [Hyphomicrobiales bacterium]|jgi:iron(III) transport system permease protein|nr:iron ABC transporter permease [Hyphomicrobiales bacterium]